MAKSSEYVVKVTYGEGNISETIFLYTPNSEVLTATDIFEVNAGSSGTFDLPYIIRGGTVSDISIDESIFGLVVQINASDTGKIVLIYLEHTLMLRNKMEKMKSL